MELQDLKTEDGLIDVPLLLDDDGEPKAGLKFSGINSPEYQEADRAWRVKNVQASARRGRVLEMASQNGAKEAVARVERREMSICVACLKEAYGFESGGQPAAATEETLKALFAKRPTWRTKCVMAIEAESDFLQPTPAPGAK